MHAMGDLCRVSASIGHVSRRARGMPQPLSHIGYVGMQGREAGAVLVEDSVWGREHALQQNGLAVAAGEDGGDLLGGGETAGTLRPEGVLRGIARREARDGEV